MGRSPNYWRNETGEYLKPAIERFVLSQLACGDIPLVRAYFEQWVSATVWDENPHARTGDGGMLALLREQVRKLSTERELYDFYELLVSEGLDPL